MNKAQQLIYQTKKKFIAFTLAGGLVVVCVSALALRYHHQVISQQISIQNLYSLINSQLSLINKISNLSERFGESKEKGAEYDQLIVEFNKLIIE